jgi:heme-degrading monooxygenase HmoA
MYGRLVEIENIDPSKREEALQNIRENVIPALKELEGYGGFVSLVDEDNRRARSIVLWETRENAEAAERQMASRREEMISRLGATVRSADLYEAPIVEVRTSAHV